MRPEPNQLGMVKKMANKNFSKLIVIITVFLFSQLFPVANFAATDHLDPTFGKNGKLVMGFDEGFLEDLKIDSNGKILAAGLTTVKGRAGHTTLIRYNPDGSLDTTFGKDGIVVNNIGSISKIVLQADGKIVTCGMGGINSNSQLVVARYNTDGSLDPSFGKNGWVITDDAHINFASNITIDNNQNIVVIAASYDNYPKTGSFGLFRYTSNGTLDEHFGAHGKVFTNVSDGANYPNGVKIDSDGKIVVAGTSGLIKFTVVRYNSDGSLDTSFGDEGIATIEFNKGGKDTLSALALQQDGKIVIGGYAEVNVGNGMKFRIVDAAIARLNHDGSLDKSFNKTGKQITEFVTHGASIFSDITLQDDGKIIAVGNAMAVSGIAVARYNVDGSLDNFFGDQGEIVTPYDHGTNWRAVAIQYDGKVVVGGWQFNQKHWDWGLARYVANRQKV